MIEKGFPWDGPEYGAQDFANAFASIVTKGIVNKDSDFVVVPVSGNVVRVGSGSAWINGHRTYISGYENIEIPCSSETTRLKRGILVLRCDESNSSEPFKFVFKVPVPNPPVVDEI